MVVARVNPLLPDGAWSCGDLSTDVLKVKQASLSPWPPVRGSSVMVYMRGEVAEAITNG